MNGRNQVKVSRWRNDVECKNVEQSQVNWVSQVFVFRFDGPINQCAGYSDAYVRDPPVVAIVLLFSS